LTKAKESNNFLSRAVFFVGWLLSPATFWNDSLVNIPLSYLLANIWIRLFPADFLRVVILSYWLTNALGVFMMYAAGKSLIRDKANPMREVLKLFLAILTYSVILFVVGKAGILKPL